MTYGTSYSTKELQELIAKMMFIKAQGSEIQKKYEFTIPDYILEEIVLTRIKLNRLNLQLMINMAVLNNKLTKEQARILKNEYCYN